MPLAKRGDIQCCEANVAANWLASSCHLVIGISAGPLIGRRLNGRRISLSSSVFAEARGRRFRRLPLPSEDHEAVGGHAEYRKRSVQRRKGRKMATERERERALGKE